jgi:hypothetical protein
MFRSPIVKTVHKAEGLVSQLSKTLIKPRTVFLKERAKQEATLQTFEENETEQGLAQEIAG